MLYYQVKPENDQKTRYKFGRRGGLEWDGIYIGGELFTPAEMEKEYKTHLVGMPPDKLFNTVNVSKKSVYWFFGCRRSTELQNNKKL